MSSVKSDTLIRNRKVTNPQERINCKLLVGPVPHAYSGFFFCLTAVDSLIRCLMVLFSSDTVRLYCVGWWTLTKSEWFRQNICFVSLMFSRSLGIFYIKCLRRRNTFLATCFFEVIRLQATCFQLIAGSTPSRFLCQWLQAQVLLLGVIIHLLTGASPWLNLYLYILAPSLSYTTKVAVYLLYLCCTFDGLLVLNVLERFS